MTEEKKGNEKEDPENYTIFHALFEAMKEKDKKRKHKWRILS